eukprot:scaffold68733_cov63-Phaeocystis_antarctica.AAC.8
MFHSHEGAHCAEQQHGTQGAPPRTAAPPGESEGEGEGCVRGLTCGNRNAARFRSAASHASLPEVCGARGAGSRAAAARSRFQCAVRRSLRRGAHCAHCAHCAA